MSLQVEDVSVGNESKDAAATKAIASIEKDWGKGSIFSMKDRVGAPVPHIRTGIYSVDHYVLGIGGVPKGRIVEIFGPEASGKTTLAYRIVAEAQRSGGKAAYIDLEHAVDATWCAKNGVNVDDLLISQPDFGEMALEIADTLVRSRAFSVVVVDSVAALVPKAELEGDFGESHMGLAARLMGQAMRKLTAAVSQSGTLLLFINQIRQSMAGGYGPSETTPGGRALRFYASQRIDIRRIGQVKHGDEIIGNRTKIKAVKNRMAPPFREVEVDLLYDLGFDPVGDLIEVGQESGVVKKAGAWYHILGQKFQGKEAAREYFSAPERTDELYKAVVSGGVQ